MIGAVRRVPPGYLEIGDDVAAIPIRDGYAVLKVDMLVESTDVPRGMGYREAARKAVAMCVSDFAAKGVRPDSFMASIGLRRGATQKQVDQLACGFRDAEEAWGVRMVGGDTNEAKELVVDCVMAGFATRIVERKGAKAGDVLVVTGLFGYPPAGLKIIMEGARAAKVFRAKALKSVKTPTPDLEIGLALSPYLTSSMDSSDGLARCLHVLAKESGVGFDLDRMPAARGVANFADQNALSLEDLVMAGGEEYVIVGTVSPKRLRAATAAAKGAGGDLFNIGRATAEKGKVRLLEGKSRKSIGDEGWTHLATPKPSLRSSRTS